MNNRFEQAAREILGLVASQATEETVMEAAAILEEYFGTRFSTIESAESPFTPINMADAAIVAGSMADGSMRID